MKLQGIAMNVYLPIYVPQNTYKYYIPKSKMFFVLKFPCETFTLKGPKCEICIVCEMIGMLLFFIWDFFVCRHYTLHNPCESIIAWKLISQLCKLSQIFLPDWMLLLSLVYHILIAEWFLS